MIIELDTLIATPEHKQVDVVVDRLIGVYSKHVLEPVEYFEGVEIAANGVEALSAVVEVILYFLDFSDYLSFDTCCLFLLLFGLLSFPAVCRISIGGRVIASDL